MDLALLRDYIGYARSYVNPLLDEASSRCLIDKYLQMRKAGSGFGQVELFEFSCNMHCALSAHFEFLKYDLHGLVKY